MKLWLIDSDPTDVATIKSLREVAKMLPPGQMDPPVRLSSAYGVASRSVDGPAFFGDVSAEDAKAIQESYTGAGQLILQDDDWNPEGDIEDLQGEDSDYGPSEEAYKAAMVALSTAEGNPVAAIGIMAMLRNATGDTLYDEATATLLDVFMLTGGEG